MLDKRIIQISKLLSTIFSPFYAPVLAFLWLFFFSYLRLLPLEYKLFILCIVFMFTIFIPRMSISIFRRLNKWSHWQLSHREHRHMPYVLALLSYTACLFVFNKINTAIFFRGIIMASLVAQIICVIVNTKWKISTHMVGMGGLLGMVIAFSNIFLYNPVWPTCGLLILSGMLGTSRMVLRQHSLAQVSAGFAVGFFCAMLFLLYVWLPFL